MSCQAMLHQDLLHHSCTPASHFIRNRIDRSRRKLARNGNGNGTKGSAQLRHKVREHLARRRWQVCGQPVHLHNRDRGLPDVFETIQGPWHATLRQLFHQQLLLNPTTAQKRNQSRNEIREQTAKANG